MPDGLKIARIVSGGQTGVDRGALDAALHAGVPCGGWCPRGRLAEDGVIPDQYPLHETDSQDYAVRTERNVCDSDGTLILHRGRMRGGTELTWRLAGRHRKPRLQVDLSEDLQVGSDTVFAWAEAHGIAVLNVAGPRESNEPGIGATTFTFLTRLLLPSKKTG